MGRFWPITHFCGFNRGFCSQEERWSRRRRIGGSTWKQCGWVLRLAPLPNDRLLPASLSTYLFPPTCLTAELLTSICWKPVRDGALWPGPGHWSWKSSWRVSYRMTRKEEAVSSIATCQVSLGWRGSKNWRRHTNLCHHSFINQVRTRLFCDIVFLI